MKIFDYLFFYDMDIPDIEEIIKNKLKERRNNKMKINCILNKLNINTSDRASLRLMIKNMYESGKLNESLINKIKNGNYYKLNITSIDNIKELLNSNNILQISAPDSIINKLPNKDNINYIIDNNNSNITIDLISLV